MLRFQKWYFLLAIILFLVEVCIAIFVNDRIIRPYIGDLLVVILIYCFIKSFFRIPVLKLAAGVLLFAYTVEVLQHFNAVHILGLQSSRLARVIIGSSFEWMDILAYTLGILLVIAIERIRTAGRKTA